MQRWVKYYKDNNLFINNQNQINSINKHTVSEQFNHLMATASLDDVQVGAYCRSNGLFSFQLKQWKESFMKNNNNQKQNQELAELKLLRIENKKLKQEIRRKDGALAETAALLVLQKKTALIWGEREDD